MASIAFRPQRRANPLFPPIGFLYLPPKVIRVGGPAKGDRTEFRSHFAIAWKLVSAVSMPSVGWYG
jgi:hypothetical protein